MRLLPLLFIASAALCGTTLLLGPCDAAVSRTDTLPATVVSAAPTLTSDVWNNAVRVDGFMNLGTHALASQKTTAAIAYDDRSIYALIRCDQTEPVTATQSANNIGFGLDDFAGIGIDTSSNGARVYYFEVTPRGIRYQQSSETARYTPNWTATTSVSSAGWTALLQIPLGIIRMPPGKAQHWRINVVRHIAFSNTNETWAYDGLMSDASFPSLGDARYWPSLGELTLRDARPSPQLEVYGLASAGSERHHIEFPDQSFRREGTRFGGLDLTYPLTPTLSFVGTLAPDSSNVEIDQLTIAPQEFRLRLLEYRPFFVQGASFLKPSTTAGVYGQPNSIFYSPSIGPFNRGEKVEGTFGFQSIGLLDVQGAGFDDQVFGIKHAVPDNSFGWWLDGVSAHHAAYNDTYYGTTAANQTNLDAGVIGRNQHSGLEYSLNYGGQFGYGPAKNVFAYKSENYFGVRNGTYTAHVLYFDIGPNWFPIDGFTNVPDVKGFAGFFDIKGHPPKGPIKAVDFFVFGDRFADRSGAAHEVDTNVQLDLRFRNGVHVQGGPSVSSLRFYDHGASLVGYPTYRDATTVPFNAHFASVAYGEGSPSQVSTSYQWGPYAVFDTSGLPQPVFLTATSSIFSRTIAKRFTATFEYDGTLEHRRRGAVSGQWLRRLSLGAALDKYTNTTIALRSVSGDGGFARPGVDVSASFRRRFSNNSEVFIDYGAPAAITTLHRLVLKYLMRFGGGS